MSNLHVLPSTSPGLANQRLAGELAAAIASGADLGPRGPHIRTQLVVLHEMVQSLQAQAGAIAANPELDDLCKQELIAAAEHVSELIARLTKAARKMLAEGAK